MVSQLTQSLASARWRDVAGEYINGAAVFGNVFMAVAALGASMYGPGRRKNSKLNLINKY